MFIYAIISIIGIGISLYAFLEVSVWGGLYFDRDYYCIEKYRKLQKQCDLISAFHNVVVSYFGILIAFTGLIIALNRDDVNLNPWFIVSFVFFVIDEIILYSCRFTEINKVKVAIKHQWDTQKRVSSENDHEVNMYRGAVRVCDSYRKHNRFFITLFLITWLLYFLKFFA